MSKSTPLFDQRRSCLIFRRQHEALSRRLATGGANRDRTDDLKLAKLALSQLSYGPVVVVEILGSGGPGKT